MKREPANVNRFLFRASEPNNPNRISDIELVDNIHGEIARLDAIENLLANSEGEEIPDGLAEIIRDSRERIKAVIDLWHEQRNGRSRSKPTARRKKRPPARKERR